MTCIWTIVDSSWNVMAHGDAWEGKWRGNWQMEWVASTLHTTSKHDVSSFTTADAHTSAASSRLNWRPRRFKWTRPFRRKTKSGFCACAITFQLASTAGLHPQRSRHFAWQPSARVSQYLQPFYLSHMIAAAASADQYWYLHRSDCRNTLIYTHTISRSLPTCDFTCTWGWRLCGINLAMPLTL